MPRRRLTIPESERVRDFRRLLSFNFRNGMVVLVRVAITALRSSGHSASRKARPTICCAGRNATTCWRSSSDPTQPYAFLLGTTIHVHQVGEIVKGADGRDHVMADDMYMANPLAGVIHVTEKTRDDLLAYMKRNTGPIEESVRVRGIRMVQHATSK